MTERADVRFSIRIRREGQRGFVAGETIAISSDSMLIRAEDALAEGQQIKVRIVVAHEMPPSTMRVHTHHDDVVELRFVEKPDAVGALIARLLAAQHAFGDFAIEALIGTGGMAEVYRALATRGPHTGSVLALKRLAPEVAVDPVRQDLFLSEADLMRMLDHPGIVDVLQTGVVENTYFIAMEYLANGSIADLLRLCNEVNIRLPVDFCCYVVGVVANALEYIHTFERLDGERAGIVHRDVTPSNILISESGDVKLTDFGVAYIGALASDEQEIVGKALYQPPEQLRGGELSPDSDVFALSAVLYEMLTGVPAFDADTVEEVQQKIRRYRVRPPKELRTEIPEGLSRLILLGLSPDRRLDRIGIFRRLWRTVVRRTIPKRIDSAADFGARVRVFGEPLYAAPEVVRVVVSRVREISRQRPLFAPLAPARRPSGSG